MNFAFYVSGSATRLNKIIEDNGKLLYNTKVVFSDDEKTTYLRAKLKKLGIDYIFIKYEDLDGDRNLRLSNSLLKTLQEYSIDYCFSFGAHILKGKILKAYENKIINFHPSVLPAYPGIKAIDKAIEDNVFILGNSAHFIDSGIDTGPIIMQSVIHVSAFYQEGYDAILDLQIEMLYKIWNLLMTNKIKIENNKVIIIGANYKSHCFFPDI